MNTAINTPPPLPLAMTFAAALRAASSVSLVVCVNGTSCFVPVAKAALRSSGAYHELRFGPPATRETLRSRTEEYTCSYETIDGSFRWVFCAGSGSLEVWS